MDNKKWCIYDIHYRSIPLTEKNPISADIYTFDKKGRADFDRHFALELGIVLMGKYKILYKNWDAELNAGKVWYCGIWESHGFEVTESPCRILVLMFWPPMLFHLRLQESLELNLMSPFVIHPSKRPRFLPGLPGSLNNLVLEIQKILFHDVSHPILRLKLTLIKTLLDIQTDWQEPSSPDSNSIMLADNYMKIARAVEMVFASHNFISEKEAAAECGMSCNSFNKKFKDVIGTNFAQFALNYRLTCAADEIFQTNLPIKSIALNWGFHDTSHFLRCFRNYYFCTPAEYRERHNSKCSDDIKMIKTSTDAVFETFLLYPNYRGWILPVNKKEIEIDVRLGADILKRKGINLHIILKRAPTGTAIAEDSQIIEEKKWTTLPAEQFVAKLDSANIPYGEYDLSVCLWDNPNGKIINMDTYKLKKFSKEEFSKLKTYFDENCVFHVDGKPYFTLGWFTCLEYEQGEGYVKYCNPGEISSDGPFNTVIFYGPLWKQMLDGINKYGIKILGGSPIGTLNLGKKRLHPAVRHNEEMEIKNLILQFKNHPAIAGWYINDTQINDESCSAFIDHYKWISRTDPDHPTYSLYSTLDDLKYGIFVTDIIGVAQFPIGARELTSVCDITEEAVKAGHGTRPVWSVVQAQVPIANYSNNPIEMTSEKELSPPVPTQEEVRCMTYLAIVGGAKGLFYYSFFDMKNSLPSAEFKNRLKQQKLIAGEIAALSAVILSAEETGKVKASCDDKDMRFLLKKHEGKYYLLTVNSKNKKKKAKFEITGVDIVNVADYFKRERSIPVKKNAFALEYEPYGIHTYVIEAGQ